MIYPEAHKQCLASALPARPSTGRELRSNGSRPALRAVLQFDPALRECSTRGPLCDSLLYRVNFKQMKVRELIALIEADGWFLVRTKGSHR